MFQSFDFTEFFLDVFRTEAEGVQCHSLYRDISEPPRPTNFKLKPTISNLLVSYLGCSSGQLQNPAVARFQQVSTFKLAAAMKAFSSERLSAFSHCTSRSLLGPTATTSQPTPSPAAYRRSRCPEKSPPLPSPYCSPASMTACTAVRCTSRCATTRTSAARAICKPEGSSRAIRKGSVRAICAGSARGTCRGTGRASGAESLSAPSTFLGSGAGRAQRIPSGSSSGPCP
jgi:hypothetical protein